MTRNDELNHARRLGARGDIAAEEPLSQPPGDSVEQRVAEAGIIRALGDEIGAHLEPRRIVLIDGTRVEVDGVTNPSVDKPTHLKGCEGRMAERIAGTGRSTNARFSSDEPAVLVDAWAHQGPPKGAQRNKVLADALKLVLVGGVWANRPRLILCFADAAAARPFTSPARTWYAPALRECRIEVHVVSVPKHVRAAIRQAQIRQCR